MSEQLNTKPETIDTYKLGDVVVVGRTVKPDEPKKFEHWQIVEKIGDKFVVAQMNNPDAFKLVSANTLDEWKANYDLSMARLEALEMTVPRLGHVANGSLVDRDSRQLGLYDEVPAERLSLINQETINDAIAELEKLPSIKRKIIELSSQSDMSTEAMVAELRDNKELRQAVAFILANAVNAIANNLDDGNRVKENSARITKNSNVVGYTKNMQSRDYATLLALSMLDGTFKRSDEDQMTFDRNGNVILGQHRDAARKALDLIAEQEPKAEQQTILLNDIEQAKHRLLDNIDNEVTAKVRLGSKLSNELENLKNSIRSGAYRQVDKNVDANKINQTLLRITDTKDLREIVKSARNRLENDESTEQLLTFIDNIDINLGILDREKERINKNVFRGLNRLVSVDEPAVLLKIISEIQDELIVANSLLLDFYERAKAS